MRPRITSISFLLLIILLPLFFFSQVSQNEIILIGVGDIMLGRSVEKRYQNRIRIDDISEILGSGDAVFGNLESCFGGEASPAQEKPYNMKAPDEALLAFKNLGITLASLANNHCADFGSSATAYTKTLLESRGVQSVGGFSNQGRSVPTVLKVKSVRIGFLGYSAHIQREACRAPDYSGIAPLDCDSVFNDVSLLRPHVDILIVSLHWGQEYSDRPAADQILTAHKLVDAGADIIWGHHPHVLQGIENYKGKLIAYSLGNFIFDQVRQETAPSIILQCGFRSGRITMVKCTPVIIDRYLPRHAKAGEAIAVMNRLHTLSNALASAPDVSSWRIQ
jgi:poly-gamma-glutamate capsule biosynthesis protein CapA/YwtB (metallophosphatase superfamily)